MRFLRNVLITILWLAATLAALVGVLLTFPMRFGVSDEARRSGQNILAGIDQTFARANTPDWLFLFWLLVLILCLMLAVFAVFGRSRRRLKIERIVDGGRVEMSPQATKHYIATALAPFSDLACRRIDLLQGRHGLEAVVHAQLRTQEDVATLERQLIQRVHSALTEDLGIANVSKVNVVIKEFGLPKGIQPKPVPPVAVPPMEQPEGETAAAPRIAERPAGIHTEPLRPELAQEPVAGQTGSGVYTAPPESAEPPPATAETPAEPVRTENSPVFPVNPAETTAAVPPADKAPVEPDEERKSSL